MKIWAFLFILSACSGHYLKGSLKQGKTSYSYTDEAGSFQYIRDVKQIDKKIVTRTQIIDNTGGSSKVLEKSIVVSELGSIKATKNKRLIAVRPWASEFTVWLEGKKYTSSMKLNSEKKTMMINLQSPEVKWQGSSEVPFPKSKYFCFYSQIPECLLHNSLLTLAHEEQNQKFNFYVMWDSYPFIQDQLTKIGKNLFSPSTIKFDGEIKGLYRYALEIEGQMVLYHFTKKFEFAKMAWITQGITIAPPGEDNAEDE